MARVITQETFDEVVRENVEDLGMDPQEAADDAVEQFTAQGVNLQNIITEPNRSKEAEESLKHNLEALTNLLVEKDAKAEQVLQNLFSVRNWCDIGIPYRLLAGRLKAYDAIVSTLGHFHHHVGIRIAALNTLTALMTAYPDLLDDKGVAEMVKCLQEDDPVGNPEANELVIAALEWARVCCLVHENNRQKLMNSELHQILSALLHLIYDCISSGDSFKASSARILLITLCKLIKSLTLDDDIRVEISRAHEHARLLATDNLGILCELLRKLNDDKDIVAQVLGTLSALVVRNEFCETVDAAGGIQLILDILISYPEEEKVNVQCLRLMKVLAGNDDVKNHLMEAGVAPVLSSSMARHQASASMCAAGCSCIAALALRSPDNGQTLVDNGAADVIVQAMKIHSKASTVQRPACLAIRNVVARKKELAPAFLSLGVEELLNSLDKDTCGDEAKAALRDLGCYVKLEEIFKGTGVKLQQ